MRTAIYARLSKDDNGEAENVEIQKAECESYAADMGWQVVEVFEDNNISAYSGKRRPGYEALKASIQAGEVECILVTETTRLNRKLWWSIDLFRLAETTPLRRIATTDGGGYDLSTRQGIHNAITAAMDAEKESMRLGERVQRKKRAQAARGEFAGGRRPYGYDYIPARREGRKVVEPGRLVVNEAERDAIKTATEDLLNGKSLRGVVAKLNAAKMLSAEGEAWYPFTLRRVLTSRRIAGFRIHNGEEHPASWPAILDPDTWEKLQLVLNAEERMRGATKKGARTYLLTGMIFCGRCGKPGEPGAPLTGYGKTDHDGQMRRRYYCRPNDERGFRTGCGQISRLAEPVEALVSEAVLVALESPKLAAALRAVRNNEEMAELIDQHRMHKLKLDDLVADYASGLLDRQQLARAKAIVEQAMEATRRRLDKLQSGRALAAVPVGQTIREAWANHDLDWRRQLVALLVDKVILHPGRAGAHRWPDPARSEAEAEMAERVGPRRWCFQPERVEIRWKV